MSIAAKICGLSDERGLHAAMEGGAAFVGFVFFRRSPRYVTLEQAGELTKLVERGIKSVGLFVNPTDAELEQTLGAARLDMINCTAPRRPNVCAKYARPPACR